jgi:hypothetical protein
MDSLLGELFGGDQDVEKQKSQAKDFVDRVETGSPTEGFSAEEALTSYSKVAGKLTPNELEDAATQALERFSPEQRREFSQLLESKTGGTAASTDDPRQIAQLTSQLQSQSPDGLVGLLGGGSLDDVLGGLLGGGSGNQGGGGGLISDLLGGLLGGGDKKSPSVASGSGQGGGVGDLLSNPIAQAILAAIAAMAMKKFMGGGGDAPSIPGLQPSQGSKPSGGDKPSDGGLLGGGDKPQRSGGLKGVDSKEA